MKERAETELSEYITLWRMSGFSVITELLYTANDYEKITTQRDKKNSVRCVCLTTVTNNIGRCVKILHVTTTTVDDETITTDEVLRVDIFHVNHDPTKEQQYVLSPNANLKDANFWLT